MSFTDKPTVIVLSLAALSLTGAFVLALLMLQIPRTAAPKKVALFPAPLTLAPETLAARAAILYDPATGRILFQKDKDESLPLASLTKLMTAQTVLDATKRDTHIRITANNEHKCIIWICFLNF